MSLIAKRKRETILAIAPPGLASEFIRHIDITDGCWMWKSPASGCAYPEFCFGGKKMKPHRIAWILANGPIPEGRMILHHCDNKNCVNPGHLFSGDQHKNMTDFSKKRKLQNRLMHAASTDAALRSETESAESSTPAKQ